MVGGRVSSDQAMAAIGDSTFTSPHDVAAEFPDWWIWAEDATWRATGPCPVQGCGGRRTIQAPDLGRLAETLREGATPGCPSQSADSPARG